MKKSKDMLVIQPSHEDSRYDVFGLRHMLKANGFKFFKKTKAWAIELSRKAEALELLELTNLDEKYNLTAISLESLMEPKWFVRKKIEDELHKIENG